MIPVKRLEIVVAAPHARRITELLASHGLTGWTLVRDVLGEGTRGLQVGDGITGVSSNHMIITTCPPKRIEAVISELRELLTGIGGMCLVSDAHWVQH